jgi:hypothetical protein
MTSALASTASPADCLRIYSPAPTAGPLHALNLQLAAAAKDWPTLPPLETVAIALPESINGITQRAGDRSRHLPIVTTADFRPARLGSGPAWHAYDRPSPDLKFVATLYDVGFGIQVRPGIGTDPEALRGKRIAAPPRPSAVRLLTEVLLRDGWDMLGDVEIVDATPQAALAAFKAGEVDALSWNLVLPGAAHFAPMLPADGEYLPVGESALARINAANDFTLALAPCLAGAPPLLSFAQALAAWDGTDDALITELLACLVARGPSYPGLPHGVEAMVRWPGLEADEMHPAALRFYTDRGLTDA